MPEAFTRVIGAVLILLGFILFLTGIGAIIGLPLMVIGLLMLAPELINIIMILLLLLGVCVYILLELMIH